MWILKLKDQVSATSFRETVSEFHCFDKRLYGLISMFMVRYYATQSTRGT